MRLKFTYKKSSSFFYIGGPWRAQWSEGLHSRKVAAIVQLVRDVVGGWIERTRGWFQKLLVGWISVPVGWFGASAEQHIHICIWRAEPRLRRCDPPPPPLPALSCPRLLKVSNTAAYDWSSSVDLHLWSKCQESSPILKCTVVTRLSDSMLRRQVWAVAWMYLATASRPLPAAPATEWGLPEGGGGGGTGSCGGAFFLPIRTLCTKALIQPPLWHDDNVQFHTASWKLTVYYVCKLFLEKTVFLNPLTTVQSVFWEIHHLYRCIYKPKGQNFYEESSYIYIHIYYIYMYIYIWK